MYLILILRRNNFEPDPLVSSYVSDPSPDPGVSDFLASDHFYIWLIPFFWSLLETHSNTPSKPHYKSEDSSVENVTWNSFISLSSNITCFRALILLMLFLTDCILSLSESRDNWSTILDSSSFNIVTKWSRILIYKAGCASVCPPPISNVLYLLCKKFSKGSRGNLGLKARI